MAAKTLIREKGLSFKESHRGEKVFRCWCFPINWACAELSQTPQGFLQLWLCATLYQTHLCAPPAHLSWFFETLLFDQRYLAFSCRQLKAVAVHRRDCFPLMPTVLHHLMQQDTPSVLLAYQGGGLTANPVASCSRSPPYIKRQGRDWVFHGEQPYLQSFPVLLHATSTSDAGAYTLRSRLQGHHLPPFQAASTYFCVYLDGGTREYP